jgi:hypothetical protein
MFRVPKCSTITHAFDKGAYFTGFHILYKYCYLIPSSYRPSLRYPESWGACYGHFLQFSRIYGALLKIYALPGLCKSPQQPLYIGVISVEATQPTEIFFLSLRTAIRILSSLWADGLACWMTCRRCIQWYISYVRSITQVNEYGSSFMRFLDYTQRRATGGRTPLDEWSARRRDLYLTTHNTHNRQLRPTP